MDRCSHMDDYRRMVWSNHRCSNMGNCYYLEFGRRCNISRCCYWDFCLIHCYRDCDCCYYLGIGCYWFHHHHHHHHHRHHRHHHHHYSDNGRCWFHRHYHYSDNGRCWFHHHHYSDNGRCWFHHHCICQLFMAIQQ